MLHPPTPDRKTDTATQRTYPDRVLDQRPLTKLGWSLITRTGHSPSTSRPLNHPLADLHRTYGNQAILHTLRRRHQGNPASPLGIQTKLTIGQLNDKYEQEKDKN